MSAQTTPATSVAAAEQEATEAEALAAALEERVREGDDSVTPEQVASQRELGRFARLRVEAARRKAARAAEAARLDKCTALAAEINAYAENSGQKFADLLRTAEDAVRAFVAAVDERNENIHRWGATAAELSVPMHQSPLPPGKEHAGLGRGDHKALISGARRIEPTDPAAWLGRMLTSVMNDPRNGAHDLKVPYPSTVRGEAAYDLLARIDAPHEAPNAAGRHFYRGPAGAVIERDQPYSREEIARLGLTVISAKEAWGR
jgi:hypothetical protein